MSRAIDIHDEREALIDSSSSHSHFHSHASPLSSTTSSPLHTLGFQELRKRARLYESSIYTKLCDYQQSYSHLTHNKSGNNTSIPTITPGQHITYEQEIQTLLGKLLAVTDAMADVLSHGDNNDESNTQILQRYRTILNDYTAEYRKAKETIGAAIQRAELLGDARGGPSSLRTRTDVLLREKHALNNSLKDADDVLGQASAAHNFLRTNAATFQNISGKMRSLTKRLPMVNQLMSKVQTHKQKDMLIMACVIATLMFFTVIYWSNKG